MKNKHCITVLFLFLMVLGGGATHWFRLLARPHKRISKKNFLMRPILFVHGYAGNRFSFGLMLKRFEKKGWGVKSAVVKVNANGKVRVTGDPSVSGAMIQVLFENNRAPVDDQAEWLRNILKSLKQNYKVTDIDIIAHSMGAVSVLSYLTKYGSDLTLPVVSKLVTLGAPYNDIEPGKSSKVIEQSPMSTKGPLQPSAIYRRLKKMRHSISPKTLFLNIIGDIDNGKSDGTVSISSARSLRYLLDGQVYSELVIKGKKATHRNLHENREIDFEINRFLSR
ncbi:alpha/beta hydrolase [Liquorilactobacillus aquaticus]